MTRTLVRWTIGETRARPLSTQAMDLLDGSIGFAKHIMDQAFSPVDFLICHNNMNSSNRTRLNMIAEKYKIGLAEVTNQLPGHLINHEVKDSWWKYAPPIIDSDAIEISMDNDVVPWRLPLTLIKAHDMNSMVALTDAVGRYYGDYSTVLDQMERKIKLNAGLVGLPSGLDLDLEDVSPKSLTDYFHSEQGFTALNFVRFKGTKALIPLSEVQQLMVNRIAPSILLKEFSGGHFCGCSYGHFNYWEQSYAKPLKELLRKEEMK